MANKRIIILKTSGNSNTTTALDTLDQVYANTESGDLVLVYPGTYDLGNNQIQLKDGVNWHFIGNPTITSTNINGTFYDNNIEVGVIFENRRTIQNTADSTKKIVLTNSNSYISDTISINTENADNLIKAITVTQIELDAIDKAQLQGHEIRYLKLSDGGTTQLFFNKTTNEWE